tara:strand:- start:2216 stop:2977 length:762 start_codon:yes stop_codon:yes gene_type:complete
MEPLLHPGLDPSPVEWINRGVASPVLLICEHAGKAVPRALGNLGLCDEDLSKHIGWDPGAAEVTRAMARILGCPAVLQTYSRLVIDCNRPPDAPDAMPAVSDGVTIPGNSAIGPEVRATRIASIFDPFHAAVTVARGSGPSLLLSIHSFTPQLMSQGGPRPWHIGCLGRNDTSTSQRLLDKIGTLRPDLTLALNQPYQIDDESDWFVPKHGEPSGLPHSLVEIRQDLIRDEEGIEQMAALLCKALQPLLETTC